MMTEIACGYTPGLIGRIVEHHAIYYHQHWGFGAQFEARVAGDLAEFVSRYEPRRDGMWHATEAGEFQGSVSVDGYGAAQDGVQIRWFIVVQAFHGQGVGGYLLSRAIEFCKSKDYRKVVLWTFEGLHVARHLYENAGFQLVASAPSDIWGPQVNQQKFELILDKG